MTLETDLPSSRTLAIIVKSPRYYTGVACRHGHKAYRTTKNGSCSECGRIKVRKPENPERKKERKRAWYVANKQRVQVYACRPYVIEGKRLAKLRYRTKHREYISAYNRQYASKNRSKILARKERTADSRNAYNKTWRAKNKDRAMATVRKRQAAKISATPPWLNDIMHEQCVQLYREAQKLSRMKGVLYHVDHIVPLRGKKVCGLHVPWNLQVITARENMQKGIT